MLWISVRELCYRVPCLLIQLFESTRVGQGQCFGVSEWGRRILRFVSVTRSRIPCSLWYKDSFGKVMCWKDRIDQLVQLIHWCGFGCLYVNDDLFCDLEDLDERKQVRRTT